MKKTVLLFTTIMIFLTSILSAESVRNKYYKADSQLRQVYEHYFGISLKDAIDELTIRKYKKNDDCYNIEVRVNGIHNKFYLGRKNVVEFRIQNSKPIYAATLGFRFISHIGPFEWASWNDPGIDCQNCTLFTPSNSTVSDAIKVNTDIFYIPWDYRADASFYPDSIFIGGSDVGQFANQYIQVNDTPTTFYSMIIEIPDTVSRKVDGFEIDNIFYPPIGFWLLGTSCGYVVPDFNEAENYSDSLCDAASVFFNVERPACKAYVKDDDRGISGFKEGELDLSGAKVDFNKYHGVLPGVKSDEVIVGLRFNYDGDIELLEQNGVTIYSEQLKYGEIIGRCSLRLLPSLCLLKGMRYMSLFARDIPQ